MPHPFPENPILFLCHPYTDLFPNVSECHRPEDGLLCHDPCLLADWCPVPPPEESHRRGVAQVLLLPGLYPHPAVPGVHWGAPCTLPR